MASPERPHRANALFEKQKGLRGLGNSEGL